MNHKPIAVATGLATLLAAFSLPSFAGVSPEEAAKLKTVLTPLGAEKAGNADGSIPAWTGGYTTPISGDKPGGRRGDPFKDEKPLFSITGKNVQQYAGKLAEGTVALLAKYPDYRLDVYPTHRTAAAPEWMYENTFKNATRASFTKGMPSGAYGGVPFPIPKLAEEVIWNHMLRWQGTTMRFTGTQYQFTSDGRTVLTLDGGGDQQAPYYFEDGSPEQFAKSGDFLNLRLLNAGPPIRAGEAIVVRNNVDSSKDQSWIYLTGQRRVRKLPNPCCDTPTPTSSGLMSFDEVFVWYGSLHRFDWKLVGKKEVYIPYNNNKMLQPKTDAEMLGSHFVNPDHVRWELHRVWVVEASLKAGQRHQAAKSRYYCDEDTWQCVIGDRWDGQGQLWKTVWSSNFVAPDLPGTVTSGYGYNDLLSGVAYYANFQNTKASQYPLLKRMSDSVFTPDAMAGEGVR
ncbi:DUF1329 domain-containing protein [Duganella phyllosphaerae]|uniref:DUF1329 domain-containing protein n=1 Tax=Duganella phyllosphaerae TaxID=762836 RepID=A0A1E7WUZ3_9BURK|nr:DUF1329 domain-containing protein [Duganella phyllosphaerae]OFA03485.1 hypothetical protein DUPY_18670 [Duganella phyllosphaerae]